MASWRCCSLAYRPVLWCQSSKMSAPHVRRTVGYCNRCAQCGDDCYTLTRRRPQQTHVTKASNGSLLSHDAIRPPGKMVIDIPLAVAWVARSLPLRSGMTEVHPLKNIAPLVFCRPKRCTFHMTKRHLVRAQLRKTRCR